MSNTNPRATLAGMIDGLSDNAAKAMIILLRTSVSTVATDTAAPATRTTRAATTRKPAAAPAAAAKPARSPRAAPAAVADAADELTDDSAEAVSLPENPTIDDLFEFLDSVEIEPQSRKIKEARVYVDHFGGDYKAIEAEAKSDAIGDRRDACEEFVASCEELHAALVGLSNDELTALRDELGLTAAEVKAQYEAYNKDTLSTAIIVAINADDDTGEAEPEVAPEPAPAARTRTPRAAAPAAPRRTRQAPAAEAPKSGGRRRVVADADDLGELEDL